MKQTNEVMHPYPKKRLGLVSGPILLSLALVVGACSNGNTTSQAATTTDSPTTTAAAITEPTTSTSSTSTSASTSASTAASDSSLETFFDELETSGFDGVVAVREGAEITTEAFGIADRENDVPIDAETVFDIGSLTKQFTGAAILRLEMDGRLSVDDTLGQHVPGLPDDKAAITLHQLLTHTAGFPAGLGFDEDPIDRTEYIALAGETPLASEPGDQFEYSNVGYSLLAAVIELETGEPYEAYLRTAVLEPAGMLDTGYVLPDWDGHTIAVGYYEPSGVRFGRPNEQPWGVDGPYWHLLGSGGLLSTAADMLRWDEALRGDQVLDETAKAKFFAPHVLDGPGEGVHYGYGWNVIPELMATPIINHSGSNGVFYADFVWLTDEDVTVFMVTNSSEDADGDVSFGAADQVLDGALSAAFGDDRSDDESGADDGESESQVED